MSLRPVARAFVEKPVNSYRDFIIYNFFAFLLLLLRFFVLDLCNFKYNVSVFWLSVFGNPVHPGSEFLTTFSALVNFENLCSNTKSTLFSLLLWKLYAINVLLLILIVSIALKLSLLFYYFLFVFFYMVSITLPLAH